MSISIIIPTFNEVENITMLVTYLQEHHSEHLQEVIVVDGGSTDDTLNLALEAGAKAVTSPQKGRAAQLHYGATIAKGDIFYFVHADTLPPKSYVTDILTALKQGYEMGRYLSSYNSPSLLLKMNALLSHLDVFEGMGGDQTLFMTKKLYERAGGFDTSMRIMEEFEFCARARKLGKYKIIRKPVLISARKYETNGWLTVQKANYTVMKMYKKGASQEELARSYKAMLNYR